MEQKIILFKKIQMNFEARINRYRKRLIAIPFTSIIVMRMCRL